VHRNMVMTGSDSGKIYVWKDLKIIHSVSAHEGAINCIEHSAELNYVVSGGQDGKIVIWKVDYKMQGFAKRLVVESLAEFSLKVDKEEPLTNHHNI
jgi:WD40 repeat protein